MNIRSIQGGSTLLLAIHLSMVSGYSDAQEKTLNHDSERSDPTYQGDTKNLVISRTDYAERLQGFWLGQNIANWTGLITEMDRVEAPFYTDEQWQTPDQKNIWGYYGPAPIIDYYFKDQGEVWGADDDTDIEYMYQYLLDQHKTSILTPEQIRDGWLTHIYSNEDAPDGENFLWVSNERAYYLMKDGILPPQTSEPSLNPYYEQIDAQLTTEIFGLFAPARSDIALRMAHLPIRTTAKDHAEWVAEFYVIMHAMASATDPGWSMQKSVMWLADQARQRLPPGSYVADMYDFIKADFESNPNKDNWEATRDRVYERYQKQASAGYQYNQPFDSGINFASSLISLFYGRGELPRTIRIAALCGWDADNPAATWGGLLGFLLKKSGVEAAFGKSNLATHYSILRTRRNFPDYNGKEPGEDRFDLMANRALSIIDRVVIEEMHGHVDLKRNTWLIPRQNPKE